MHSGHHLPLGDAEKCTGTYVVFGAGILEPVGLARDTAVLDTTIHCTLVRGRERRDGEKRREGEKKREREEIK